jgi:hypothetical protein
MSNEQFNMLMKLAENTSDGAFWLVVVFFTVKVIGWLIAATVAVTAFHYIKSLFSENVSQHELYLNEIYFEATGTQIPIGKYEAAVQRAVLRRICAKKDKDGTL